MAKTYSNDLREKFLKAYLGGGVGLKKLAQRFGVSYGWGQKIWGEYRRSGSMERPQGRPRGFASRLTPELREQLRGEIGRQPDRTLKELQGWLEQQRGVEISVTRLSAILQEMGLRRKKKPARSRTGHGSGADTQSGLARQRRRNLAGALGVSR